MDHGIVDAINRRDAQLITAWLDLNDLGPEYTAEPWYRSPVAATLMDERPGSTADRAWLIGTFAARVTGIAFDGAPADCDWDNLFAHFRDEIIARRNNVTRDPIPSVRQSSPCGMV